MKMTPWIATKVQRADAACCWLGLVAVLMLPAGALCAPATFEQTAKQILDTSGVKGGLVVHIGCGDGKQTAALRANNSFVVHGLDADVTAVRKHIQSLGLYGPVSVEKWAGDRLPYTDNVVNLVVAEKLGQVPMAEVLRVLTPNGVAVIGGHKTVKHRPTELDEWTHFLHGPDNNAVAHDAVSGPPRHLQWLADPGGARHHDVLATISAAVFAGGRMFVIEDEGPTAAILLPARWQLVARDAFNGLLLWKQPIGRWESHLRKFRSGPTHLPRRLVADGQRLFVTLGYDQPVTALDAATGRLVRTYTGTEGADEIVLADNVLYVVREQTDRAAVWALNADTGQSLWKKAGGEVADIATQTLAVDKQVFAQIGNEVVSWDRATGRQLWRSARSKSKGGRHGDGSRTPTLVACGDVVLSADGGNLIALSAADGHHLWTVPTTYGYQSPIDVFFADGLVWTGTGTNKLQKFIGCDLRTGETKREFDTGDIYGKPGMAHHRCYRDKATDRFLVLGRAGIELCDLRSGESEQNNWTRGTCQYGVVPCNGLIYAPPHACGCYLQGKLNGFLSFAPPRKGESREATGGARLEHSGLSDLGLDISDSDWPTYRHDATRGGATAVKVPAGLKPRWRTSLGGKPSAPVMASGLVFVAVPDAHCVCALDAGNGKLAWQFTAGGRVDSPPTIDRGRAIFGCADGYVYCLRAADGGLVWRFRAAPEERRTVVREQLESVWPAHGSVLVRGGQVSCVAGRSSFLDGGMRLVRLDAGTGTLLGETALDGRDPKTGKQPQIGTPSLMEAALNDVLSSNGRNVFLRHVSFDAAGRQVADKIPHLFSPAGFLDDSWWIRSYFSWSDDIATGFTGWRSWSNTAVNNPSGQILVCDESKVYGFTRRKYQNLWPVNYEGQDTTEGREYVLFSMAKTAKPASGAVSGNPRRQTKKGGARGDLLTACTWSRAVPMKVTALVLAGDVLFAAGPSDLGPADKDPDGTWEGKRGGVLAAFSAADGKPLGDWKLDALPVWDGMAVARAQLYLSLKDGSVLCLR